MLASQRTKVRPYELGYVPHSAPQGDEYDDTLMSKEEFFAMLDRAEREIEEGKFTRVSTKEELAIFLDSL
jgi:hypothetical protein